MLVLSLCASVQAQTVLFTNPQPPIDISPPPTIYAFYDIDVNLADIKLAPSSIQIDFPDNTSTLIPKGDFISRGANSYKWSGSNADYDVVLTVHNGQLLGYITSDSKRYGIELLADGVTYRLLDFNLSQFPENIEIDTRNISKEPQMHTVDNTFTSHLKSFNALNVNSINKGNQNFTILDILVVWMEEARIEAGGAANDPNDTQGIETLIMAAVDHANTALANSLSTTRIVKIHTAKLTGFSLSGDAHGDLQNFRAINSVKTLRTQVGADMVSGIIESDFGQFVACGISHNQTVPDCTRDGVPGCGVGMAFDDFAYDLITQFCAIWDDTFTHEAGHLMGGNHARDEQTITQVNAVVNNGFSDAFAWRNGTIFKSILSVENDLTPTTARRLYFSNPDVSVNNVATGVSNTANNRRVIDSLTPVMATFRSRPDLIFVDGFE